MDTDTGRHDGDPVQEPDQDRDLEYDLAHEHRQQGDAPARGGQAPAPVYVATETLDYDGDYGYDLAHDVPRRSPSR